MSRDSELVRGKLVAQLADGDFHSGELLGEYLGISRAAISKHIKALMELGLDVFSVSGKGYRLAKPLNLLNKVAIESSVLHSDIASIEVVNVIDSTNQYIKQNIAKLENGHLCLAEAQTAGKGRHGRKWVSPYGASLYMSMYWSFSAGYQAVNGVSLVIGLSIIKALNKLGIKDAGLKWPNDVYVQDRKLAGVLIEVEGQMGAACDCVIGVGLNVQLPEKQLEIDQPWIDLQTAAGQSIDRNALCVALINEMIDDLLCFENNGLESFLSLWHQHNIYQNKPVKLLAGTQTIVGINKGVNDSGALLIESDGIIKAYHGGEISVRPA